MRPKIWLTRPTLQASATQLAFEGLGFTVVPVPVLQIKPVDTVAAVQAVREKILDFDRYDMAIFVSQNAVQYGCAWLDEFWPQLPEACEFYAIGSATRQALLDAGLPVLGEIAVNSAMNSESLLATPEMARVKHKQIIVFRGAGGRTHLGEQLEARGAKVDYCELYARALPDDAQQAVAQALDQGDAWLSAHSGESLQNLFTLLARATTATTQAWRRWPLLVPGRRVEQLAVQLGFKNIIVAENAADNAMCEALAKQLAQ